MTNLVPVPRSEALATEPALTIGREVKDEYAGKDKVKLAVSSLFGLAVLYGVSVPEGVEGYVQTLVQLATPIGIGVYAWWQTNRTRKEQSDVQARKTREAVYAPATVNELVQEASRG